MKIRFDHNIIRVMALIWLAMNSSSAICADHDSDYWWHENLEQKALDVNEGDLVFLLPQTKKKIHHHHNRVLFQPHSFNDGWIILHQCHHHIDAVSEAQIVYHRGRVRELSIESSKNIDRAWVEGHSVQLRDIQPDAWLCVRVSSKALTVNGDGTYTLNHGPFMRRFLDGYYPLHVTIEIDLPSDCLHFQGITPPQQEGFKVQQMPNRIFIDTWFEGRLQTAITLAKPGDGDAMNHCSF